jgi:hypothetical protein
VTLEREKYVPLSVRYGGPRKKLGWWIGTQREKAALRLAPWLRPPKYVHEPPDSKTTASRSTDA